MKKLHLFFSLIMIALFSCVQQDDNNSSNDAKSVEKTLTNVNIDMSKYHNPISLDGNVKVWVNKNNELVAYTQTDTHIHLFVLQYLQNEINPNENYKSISFLDHSFSLISDSGNNILCEVANKNESILAGNDLKQITGISDFKKITGGGVAHIWLDKNEINQSEIDSKYGQIKLKNSVYDLLEKNSDPLNGGECQSGGPGSTSCSVTGCSVSCASGYYACCIPSTPTPSCKCISNVPVIEG